MSKCISTPAPYRDTAAADLTMTTLQTAVTIAEADLVITNARIAELERVIAGAASGETVVLLPRHVARWLRALALRGPFKNDAEWATGQVAGERLADALRRTGKDA